MSILWTIVIGLVAGTLAKFLVHGGSDPKGFVLTSLLGVAGAFVASYAGQAIGWYAPGQGAGLVGSIVGAVVVLIGWGAVVKRA
jgi:uncharacterized membrane protein YeaQ/YmgE (transglycosylase-associated protein family)